jgi:hypothetical protein
MPRLDTGKEFAGASNRDSAEVLIGVIAEAIPSFTRERPGLPGSSPFHN